MAKIGNNPDLAKIRKKKYRHAAKRILKGESQVGDRDKWSTLSRLFFQDPENKKAKKTLLAWLQPREDEEEDAG